MNAFRHRPPAVRGAIAAIAAAFALALLCGPVAQPAAAQQYVTVIIGGQPMTFDQPPIVRDGRVFVPLRGVFERLGASVVYSNGQINATGQGRTISLTIGSTQAVVNGQPTTLDVAPFLVGARTLVPLRFIAESLGAHVNWNNNTSTVTINHGGGPVRPNPPPPQPVVDFTQRSPTGTIYNHFPQIQFQINRPLQIGQFQVMINGRGVATNVQSNGQYFYLPAPWSIPFGNTRVRVQGRTVGGVPFDLNWTFFQAAR
jgi:hypothetical protein